MAILRDTIEIMGPTCQVLVNQQGDQVVLAIEGWTENEDKRFWSRLELDPKDANRLTTFLEQAANDARKVQDDLRKGLEAKS
jgi:hypothetical protein